MRQSLLLASTIQSFPTLHCFDSSPRPTKRDLLFNRGEEAYGLTVFFKHLQQLLSLGVLVLAGGKRTCALSQHFLIKQVVRKLKRENISGVWCHYTLTVRIRKGTAYFFVLSTKTVTEYYYYTHYLVANQQITS